MAALREGRNVTDRVLLFRFRMLYGDSRDAFFAVFDFREKIDAFCAAVKFASE